MEGKREIEKKNFRHFTGFCSNSQISSNTKKRNYLWFVADDSDRFIYIVFIVLTFPLAGSEQGGSMPFLMDLLQHGGFFRDNGLNSLPSINHAASLLGKPDIFKNFNLRRENIETFLIKSKHLIIRLKPTV